jgi:hypothetical protein
LALAGGEEAGVRAAGPDGETDLFGTFGAIAFVGGSVSVDIDSGVDVTARELDADEFPFREFAPAGTMAAGTVT